jgi:hypothetical protein
VVFSLKLHNKENFSGGKKEKKKAAFLKQLCRNL